jgi:hypothetical protein
MLSLLVEIGSHKLFAVAGLEPQSSQYLSHQYLELQVCVIAPSLEFLEITILMLCILLSGTISPCLLLLVLLRQCWSGQSAERVPFPKPEQLPIPGPC